MMNLRSTAYVFFAAALSTMLVACATGSEPQIKRTAGKPGTSQGQGSQTQADNAVTSEPLESEVEDGRPRPRIRRGNGQVINAAAANAPLPDIGATSGEARFNFEGESLHAVVKAILGDMLGQNYTIALNV